MSNHTCSDLTCLITCLYHSFVFRCHWPIWYTCLGKILKRENFNRHTSKIPLPGKIYRRVFNRHCTLSWVCLWTRKQFMHTFIYIFYFYQWNYNINLFFYLRIIMDFYCKIAKIVFGKSWEKCEYVTVIKMSNIFLFSLWKF